MSHTVDKFQEDGFKWGPKMDIVTSNTDVNFYKSFIYHGVEYLLYDCVCMFRDGSKETDIGKIIKIWEKRQEKKMKILWFFRPIDIRHFLRDYEPSWNELFLASGEGKGLSSIMPPESIVGKCSVICSSKDSRNTLPSKSDLGKAEYFFSHTFDVGKLTISEKFPYKIDTIKVECLFNREKDKPKASGDCVTGVPAVARARDQGKQVHSVEKDCQVGTAETGLITKDSIVKDETSRTSEDFRQHISERQPIKKRKLQPMGDSTKLVQRNLEDPKSILDPLPSYGTKSSPNNPPSNSSSYAVVEKETYQATSRIAANKDIRSWFLGELPWERRAKMAQDREILVCLDNLDPSFTSSDIEDLILKAFKVESEAKVIPAGSFSSPSYGQALVILNSKDDADFILEELRGKCLMIGERPLVASRKGVGEFGKPCSYPGHLIIERFKRRKWSEEHKQAVSTSHCSQPNTIEYEMATQWRMLQAKSDLWWKALNEKQAEEVSKYRIKLKRRESSEPPPAAGGRSRGSSSEPVESNLEKGITDHKTTSLPYY